MLFFGQFAAMPALKVWEQALRQVQLFGYA
jgi:hypothetical protein